MPHILKRSMLALALVAAAGVASANNNGVTSAIAVPSKGTIATKFKIDINGNGSCSLGIAVSKAGNDGFVWTLTENLPVASFPRSWDFKVPAGRPPLSPGKYFVKVDTHLQNGCNNNMEKIAEFEVSEIVLNLPPAPPKCPEGWQAVSGSANGAYICKPKKPAPQPCPPKHEWFDDGCTAGCRQIIY